MKCEDSRELLIEYALDQLDPVSTAEVRGHLNEGCRVCAQTLNEFVETWASLGASLDPVSPAPEVETKLLSMIRGQTAPPVLRADRRTLGTERSARVLSFALAASLVGVAVAVLAWRFTPLERIVAGRGATIVPREIWATSPTNESPTGFQTVALNPIAEKQGVQLSVVMIPQSSEWHIISRGLPNVEGDAKFQIWLETKSGDFQKLAVLPVEKPGRGGVTVDVAQIELAGLAGLWLTVESESDSARPSESVLFRAMVK